jgi:hypothetical protein
VLWLALASRARDVSFEAPSRPARHDARREPRFDARDGGSRRPGTGPWTVSGRCSSRAWTPLLALALVLAVPAWIETVVLGRPFLLVSLAPSTLIAVISLAPRAALAAAAGAALFAFGARPSLSPRFRERSRRSCAGSRPIVRAARVTAVVALATLAGVLHVEGARREQDLRRRLDEALVVRDRGDLAAAQSDLRRISLDYPSSHAAKILLGESPIIGAIATDPARPSRRPVAIKPDAVVARRYLAALALERGDSSEAAVQCARASRPRPTTPT